MNRRNEPLSQTVDRRLNGLRFDEAHQRAVLQAIKQQKEERPMKRKLTLTLALALVLTLLTTAALAASFLRAPSVNVKRLATQALMDKYGLSAAVLGMFDMDAEEQNGTWIVTVSPTWQLYNEEWRVMISEMLGEYTVVVEKDKVKSTTWTHDDVDPAIWQGGDLTADVWGQSQLYRLALTDPNSLRDEAIAMLKEKADNLENLGKLGTIGIIGGADGPTTIILDDSAEKAEPESKPGDITADQACELALGSVLETYRINAGGITGLDRMYEPYLAWENDRRAWQVGLFFIDENEMQYTTHSAVDAENGEILLEGIQTGGNG